MQETPFSRIARTSRRLNIALFGILPVALIMIGALLWGAQRIIKQEEDRLLMDFAVLVGYIHEQEGFLLQFRKENQRLDGRAPIEDTKLSTPLDSTRPGLRIYRGQHALVAMPFSLFCNYPSECPVANSPVSAAAGYFADFYSTYWANSYFPAAAAFLINKTDSLGIAVPAINVKPGYGEPLSEDTLLLVNDAVRARLASATTDDATSDGQIQWISPGGLPDRMMGLLHAGFSGTAWTNRGGGKPDVYVATLLSRARINIYDRALPSIQYDGFWLTHRDIGLMLGEGPLPAAGHSGLSATRDGLILQVSDPSSIWTAYYRVSYRNFFEDNLWLPITAALLLLLSLAGGIGYQRWYTRRVIEPAQNAHRDIAESEEFNRTLIQTAPIALCVLARANGDVLFANSLALEWLGAATGQGLRDSPAARPLLDQVLTASAPGTIETFHADDGRPLYVAYSPTRYKKQDVVLCAFADISARAEIERALAQAKRDADKASEAKSTFLATMSHEIRTPLYGVLGTLELMGMTELNAEQRQHLERIQNSSVILLQLISDILDITKIESGQLALDSSPFRPRELVESCARSFAALARQKGLLLFACVDGSVAPWVTGDAVRIRQILSNLLSNAIKFTESGHVIVRLHGADRADGTQVLALQVVDTGIGIDKEDQAQLFSPFYQIDSASHTVRGAGIGLSICARLARLMDSHIRVTSELGLGSSFSLELALLPADGPPVDEPDLHGIRIYVRSPHRELTDNVCQWLTRWGADAQRAPAPLGRGEPDDVLLDILGPTDAAPANWTGHFLSAGDPRESAAGAPDQVDGHDLDSIGFGISRLLRGDPPVPAAPAANPLMDPLDLRVLVAEDNPINQATLRHQLEQLGCTVTVAGNGADALSMWNMATYDVLLTDVNMPKMNGYELTGELRSRGYAQPIIGVTANAMRDEEARCMAAGMNSWLVKPIELSALRRHLGGITRVRADAIVASDVPEEPEEPKVPDVPEESLNQDNLPVPAHAAPEPLVPEKYRRLFLDTMDADLANLDQAVTRRDVTSALQTMHRMRGALVMVKMTTLSSDFQAIESKLRRDGGDDEGFQEVTRLTHELRILLAQV
ncbi:response regulator [Achromobacter spanius]|uniref:hybrid sensor histidine kinase/response regulator n=1 Tax=Achromobacter spanius TaxID=217203 RepID=UPI003A8ED258